MNNTVISNKKVTKNNSSFFKRHPMLTFYFLVFAISWGCILAVIGLEGFCGITQMTDEQMPLVYMATLAGPSLAGILSAALVYGKAGLEDIKSRLFKWRAGARWYAMALLTAPILMTVILLTLSLTPAIVSSADKVSMLASAIVVGLVVSFFEELGWTGFAIPQLRKKYGVLSTGIIVGILWGVWHFPLFSASASASGVVPSALYVAILLFSWLPAYRVLMTLVYDKTKSLLLMIFMHFPIVVGQFVLLPAEISGLTLVVFELAFAAALWIIVTTVVKLRKQ